MPAVALMAAAEQLTVGGILAVAVVKLWRELADEREACANVCEQARDDEWAYSEEWAVLDGCLAGIRARGAA